MAADGLTSLVTERLDSLWFFSNVFSSPPPPPPPPTTITQVSEPVISTAEEVSKHVSENIPTQVEVEPERGNGKRLSRRRRRRKRKVLGEIGNLGSNENNIAKVSFECGYCRKLGCLYDHYKNMPPLHDNIAMKQHLKSWACAVACTVK